nr:glycosyltransferase family 1 protein [Terribacillus saccharophilus]
MKIVIITETFLPSTDGVVTRLTEAIKYLRSQKHEVVVIAPDLGVTEYEGALVEGVGTVTMPFYRSKKFSLPTRRIKTLLEKHKPDLVHVANPALVGVSGIHYAHKKGLPLLASYHTHVPKYLDYYKFYKPLKPLFWWHFRRLHNATDINLCTSVAIKQELDEHGFERMHVLRRGVDVEKRHPDFHSESMRERLLQGDHSKKLLIFVGRLAIEKEIHKIRPLLDERDDLALAIIGDGPARKELEKIFAGTNTMFTGFLHGEELSQAFASADAFLFPSITETLGLVILEAMASGIPVIAAKSGPTLEQIEEGKTGFLFENEDVASMSKAVGKLDDLELAAKMKQNVRIEAERHSWTNASSELFDYYLETIQARSPVYQAVQNPSSR